MNAFKLLARSTNLSDRKASLANASRTPSAGSAESPQIFRSFGDDTISLEQPPRKKRKASPRNKKDITVDLDFFASGQDVSATSRSSNGPLPSKPERRNVPSTITEAPKLDVEECQKILKSHKLRITILWELELHTSKKPGKNRKSAIKTLPLDKRKSDIIPQPLLSFTHLQPRYKLSPRIAENLEDEGYRTPTEVQLASLPLLLDPSYSVTGEPPAIDILSIAPTGSGKTLAFLIPVVHAILRTQRSVPLGQRKHIGIQAVILAPTKELARQITNEARKLTQKTGLKVTLVRKGMRLSDNGPTEGGNDSENSEDANDHGSGETFNAALVVKSQILVSTPGIMANAITTENTDKPLMPTVKYLVLDEADVLLDPLFKEQTISVWNACVHRELRVSLWSATMGASIEDFARSKIVDRYDSLQVPYDARAKLVRLVVGLKDSALPTIHHKLTYCATEAGKLLAMRQMLHPTTAESGPQARPPLLVFTQTIQRAVALHSELLYDIPAAAGGPARIAVLHADLSDSARDAVMTRFRRGEIWVLITTDLLSRGVDFKGVNAVVNYDFPGSSAAYVHRVGRTGRAGRQGGVAVTLYAKEDVPVLGVVANVIAATEKQRDSGNVPAADGSEETKGMEKWMVDLLPRVNKRDRQKLKKGGIDSRRKNAKESRISTKSGHQRRFEERRKSRNPSTKRKQAAASNGHGVLNNDLANDDEFSGLSDA